MDVGVNYALHRGARKSAGGLKRTFYCRRSGVGMLQSSNEANQKRLRKSQGTIIVQQNHLDKYVGLTDSSDGTSTVSVHLEYGCC